MLPWLTDIPQLGRYLVIFGGSQVHPKADREKPDLEILLLCG